MRLVFQFGLFCVSIALLTSWMWPFFDDKNTSPYELTVPKGFPKPPIPVENELTVERIKLGRMLFYDPIMSMDSSISCASCHVQNLAFSDKRIISPGVEGRVGTRNAPTLANVVYNPSFLFDGFLKTLEMQILVPIQEHAEFSMNILQIARRLNQNAEYIALSLAAYNRIPDAYVITRAISSFERTLISGDSKYDQFNNGNETALNKSEKRGMNLFFNEMYCTSCHGGFNFTDFSTKNNGLYEVYADSGRARSTFLVEDRAMFKIPTLRNIGLTAPYMHDGSLPDLESVLDHYMSGGTKHLNKSGIIQPFKLSKRDKSDVVAFLLTLTDSAFITNEAFSNPFESN